MSTPMRRLMMYEMVHQWENQTYGRMGHGKRFVQWQDRISNYLGLDIHITADEDEYTYGKGQIYKRRYQSPK